MRIVDGFTLRKVAGEMIICGESIAQVNFNKLIVLNESAAYLWSEVIDTDFTAETLAELLVSKYGIDNERALADVSAILENWLSVGLVKM